MAKTTTSAPKAVVMGDGTAAGAKDARTAAPAPADPPAVKAQSVSPRARKAADTKPEQAKKPAKPAAAKAKAPKKKGSIADEPFVHTPKGPDLREDLRLFIQAHPAGWGHADWLAFLDHLAERSHDTSDPEAIGRLLERERLWALCETVQGMGPRRIQALVDRYDTAWSAQQAGVDDIAILPGMNRSLAEKVRQTLNA